MIRKNLNLGGLAWTCPESVWMDREIGTTTAESRVMVIQQSLQSQDQLLAPLSHTDRSVEATGGEMCFHSSLVTGFYPEGQHSPSRLTS